MFDADINIRVLTAKDVPLVLECANRSTVDKVLWLKEKKQLSSILGNADVKIDNETGSLKILKEKEEVYGNYTCTDLTTNATVKYRVVREYSGTMFLDL